MDVSYPYYLSVDNKFYDYYNVILPTFKSRLDIDYEAESTLAVKSLVDLCCEKLVMNVHYLDGCVQHLPHALHLLILRNALILGRTLSIKNLLSNYPERVFVFPTPNELHNWSVLEMSLPDLRSNIAYITFLQNIMKVMGVFFDNIHKNENSNLQILDMYEAFVPVPMLHFCWRNLSVLKNTPQKQYLLKAGFLVMSNDDLSFLKDIKNSPFDGDFKIHITGLSFLEGVPSPNKLSSLLSTLDENELLHFSFDLCGNVVHPIFPELKKFHHLQSLSLTYVEGFTWKDTRHSTLIDLAESLYYLPFLKRLRLSGSRLTNCLQTLLMYNCQSMRTPQQLHSNNHYHNYRTVRCCVLHHGIIELLDFETCRLTDEDVICLGKISSSNSLKSLNIGYSKFEAIPLSETLEKLKSLVSLNITNCISYFDAEIVFAKFENLPLLKCINLSDLDFRREDIEFLSTVIEKMPNLRVIILSYNNANFRFNVNKEDFENILLSRKQIKIIWHQRYSPFIAQ